MSEWKETEFGKIPFDWDFITAQEYCVRVTDGTHDSPKEQAVGKYLITSKHIRGRDIDFQNAYLISEEDFNKINIRSKVDQWDVIISMIGEYCGFCYVERNADVDYVVKNVGLLKTDSKDKAYWLYYFLNSKIGRSTLETNKSGTSQPYLTLGFLRDIPILYPPNDRIAVEVINVIKSLDDKIDLLHRQNKTLEQLAETLFRQWFVEEAGEDWEIKKIAEVALINDTTIGEDYPHTEIEYLDTGSVTKGRVESFQYYLLPNAPSRAQRIPKEKDIVYSLVRPIQRHYALLQDVQSNFVVSTGFCVISCDRISPYFIYTLLTLDEVVEYFDMVAEGSTSAYPSLKPSDIGDFEFKVPPINKIKEFSKIAESNYQKIKTNSMHIRTLTQLRDTLLPKLMSGEVRVRM